MPRKLRAYSLYAVSRSGHSKTYTRISNLSFPLRVAKKIFYHAGHNPRKDKRAKNWVVRPTGEVFKSDNRLGF